VSWLGSALALAVAFTRLLLGWLAERPAREAERQAARLARQRDEANRPPLPPRGLLERMRDGRL
jgi:hypothetical protein